MGAGMGMSVGAGAVGRAKKGSRCRHDDHAARAHGFHMAALLLALSPLCTSRRLPPPLSLSKVVGFGLPPSPAFLLSSFRFYCLLPLSPFLSLFFYRFINF